MYETNDLSQPNKLLQMYIKLYLVSVATSALAIYCSRSPHIISSVIRVIQLQTL